MPASRGYAIGMAPITAAVKRRPVVPSIAGTGRVLLPMPSGIVKIRPVREPPTSTGWPPSRRLVSRRLKSPPG